MKITKNFLQKLIKEADQNHLKDQDSKLGRTLNGIMDLKIGKNYCIVDPGLDEWNGGYKFEGIKGKNDLLRFIFQDTLSPLGREKFTFTKDEILDMIKNKEIAFDIF